MSVQAAVPDVVWWPANIIEMNMPVTRSGLKRGPPSSSVIDMSTSSRSRSSVSGAVSEARPFMMFSTSDTSPTRASSRRRKLSMGA